MRFNTAILFDLENLIGGYSGLQTRPSNSAVDLRDVLERVKEVSYIEQFAVLRAYANWSVPGLAGYRGEISELGIDPIQVFGFSQNGAKNAADIQLAIDAIDLANLRTAIDVFVIVSGDGGFASLAKKLHEYGKTVVGVGYEDKASRVLKSVCDVYIELSRAPEEVRPKCTKNVVVEKKEEKSPPVQAKSSARIDAQGQPAIKSLLKNATSDPIKGAVVVKEIFKLYESDPNWSKLLMSSGIGLNVVKQMTSDILPNLKPIHFGYSKFSELLQCVCADSQLKVGRFQAGHLSLVSVKNKNNALILLEDLVPHIVHSVEGYTSLLVSKGFMPQKLNCSKLQLVISAILKLKPKDMLRGEIIEAVAKMVECDYPTETSRHAVMVLSKQGILMAREPAGEATADALTLSDAFGSEKDVNLALRTVASEHIRQELNVVKNAILLRLFPDQ